MWVLLWQYHLQICVESCETVSHLCVHTQICECVKELWKYDDKRSERATLSTSQHLSVNRHGSVRAQSDLRAQMPSCPNSFLSLLSQFSLEITKGH